MDATNDRGYALISKPEDKERAADKVTFVFSLASNLALVSSEAPEQQQDESAFFSRDAILHLSEVDINGWHINSFV